MKRAETVTFGGGGLERAAHRRNDTDWLDAALARGKILPLWRGKPLVQSADATALGWVTPSYRLVDESKDAPIFLGLTADETPLFATDVSHWEPEGVDLSALGQFLDPSQQAAPELAGPVFAELRAIMTRLTPLDAEIAATAKAVLGWHRTHGFCAKCGAASEIVNGGWQRSCPACGASHFPRTDPVVIMLITHGNSVLLGRSPGWPEGMFSLLAGFVEPGETLEAAVRREVMEEAGIGVGEVSYLSSQPWPFPASLMFGAWGKATSTEIHIDPEEIEDARWVSREELALAFAGSHPDILPARKGAIAHFLLHHWLSDTLD